MPGAGTRVSTYKRPSVGIERLAGDGEGLDVTDATPGFGGVSRGQVLARPDGLLFGRRGLFTRRVSMQVSEKMQI